MEWLSGSGGTGETRLNDGFFAGKPRLQRSGTAAACPWYTSKGPLQPVLLECNWVGA